MARMLHKRSGPRVVSGGRKRNAGPDKTTQTPVELDIVGLTHDGRGIARIGDKKVFVGGALPNERVRAQVTQSHKQYDEARLLDVISPSDERIAPACQHFSTCGGCRLQHLEATHQLEYKQTALLDQLKRWAKVEPLTLLPSITSPEWGYRNRARLSVWYDRAGKLSIGFREQGSKRIVDIQACPVLHPDLAVLLPSLKVWLGAIQHKRSVGHIELLHDGNGAAVVVCLNAQLPQAERQALCDSLLCDASRIWFQTSKQVWQSASAEPVQPELHYTLSAYDLQLAYQPSDFTQVNSHVNSRMVDQAIALLQPSKGETVLDLFCGIGNFTLPLARYAKHVIGVEGASGMVARGQKNATVNQLGNVEFVASDLTAVDATSAWRGQAIDHVLLDPPRAGAAEAIPLIAQLGAKSVVYVSCNPATLARDTQQLVANGYQLHTLGVVDMFPHTEHVESMAYFVRTV